jgi:RNA polymerase sigma factor (sigma-70 family)
MSRQQDDRWESDSTRWSVVLAAANRGTNESDEALETLCRTYWYPLYAFARKRLGNATEAQDMTQEFFVSLLEKKYLAEAHPERGRFRAFLLTAFKHFLSKQWHKAHAIRRGGELKQWSLDVENAELRYRLEPVDELTPERLFDRQWGLTLTNGALAQLEADYAAAKKHELFQSLKRFLAGSPVESNYAELARSLNMTDGAVRVAIHRLRHRYGECLRAAIADTVSNSDEIDDEIRTLFSAFS